MLFRRTTLVAKVIDLKTHVALTPCGVLSSKFLADEVPVRGVSTKDTRAETRFQIRRHIDEMRREGTDLADMPYP